MTMLRSRSSSNSSFHARSHRKGISLDRNNNNIRIDRQTRLVHNTSKHLNEGFFGASENIHSVDSRSNVEKKYDIGPMIGQGNFSRVFFAVRRSDNKKCALKEVDKTQLRGKWFFVENEVEIMQMCKHKNIARVVDAFKSSHKYFLLFDYAQNGDLFEAIRIRGRISEPNAAFITEQTSSALSYLHSRKIVHRDVKPENLLLYSNWNIRLCDFGLACTVLGPLYRVCGTPTYCAPEVLKECGYGVLSDIWSLGVLLHVMLLGYAPFRSSERNRLFRLIMQGKLHFDLPDGKRISSKARDLMSRMMSVIPDKRPKACEIAYHPWIQNYKMEDGLLGNTMDSLSLDD